MKLVSLNMEGDLHLDRIPSFLLEERPDTICLQEAPLSFQTWLHENGYNTAATTTLLRQRKFGQYEEGIILASKYPLEANISYYYKDQDHISVPRPGCRPGAH